MGDIIFLGHGSLDTASSDYPEVADGVLIPPGTTVKFYTDAGDSLSLDAYENKSGEIISDYRQIAGAINGWKQFQEDKDPLGPGKVTYNFALSPEDTEEERDLAKSLDWGGAEIKTLPDGSKDWYLCQGTADTCPTPKLIAGGNTWDDVPEDRKQHHCDGILGKHAGNDLHWMCCTALLQDVPAALKEIMDKSQGIEGKYEDVPFMDEGELKQLRGTPRPKTLKEIEDSTYWQSIFEKWMTLQDSGVQAAYAAYVNDPNGTARDTLKNAGPNGDLRKDFYDAVGEVKDKLP